MVDFRKKLGKKEVEKKIIPLDIYNELDRRSITGPLRPAQSKILDEWFNHKQKEHNLIIKLHTGEGKTLIGLLILQSKINQGEGPCVFVCPNIYLSQQVAQEATKFGIPYCLIEEDNNLPNDFIEGKKILVVHVQKLFNGKSIFGIDNNYIHIGSLVLDDSHACIDAIKDSFTVRIKREHSLYGEILSLFEDDLTEQGEGDFLDIRNGDYDALLPIPYWSWIDKKSEVANLLSKYREENELAFTWPLIKNCLEDCQAFITGNGVEILPYHIPIRSFGSFANANQRILMSATTQDDSFFIKGLGFDINAIKNPLINTEQKWSGEKMILIPSLIDDSLDRDLIVSTFAKPNTKLHFGRVAIVPSHRRSEQYYVLGSTISGTKNIFTLISDLKAGNIEKTLVIINRYDGIDLPDESCRLLIIDSMPYFNSLVDRYEEQCRVNSDIINIRLAQRIEQGLGRSVRGEKDYSVILLIGADLVKFIRSTRTSRYFSPQTKKQIDIGFQIADMAKEDLRADEPALKVVTSLIVQALVKRDEGWKEFYREEMDKLSLSDGKSDIYDILELEKEAEAFSFKKNHEETCNKIQIILDKHIKDDSERGWYMQILARYKYFISKTDSNKIQKSAFSSNLQLLKPKDGITYRKINVINDSRIYRIKKWIAQYKDYNELVLAVDGLLNNFTFGVNAEKFETSLQEIGALLGFISQRPDKEIRKGPDNLWGGVENKFFLLECKSEVNESRETINKHEAAQMNSHCGWFENEYGKEALVKRILIIPTHKLSYEADFTHKVDIMRKGKMKIFKNAIRSFIKEFKSYNINEIEDIKIQEFINIHKLNIQDIEELYTEAWSRRS